MHGEKAALTPKDFPIGIIALMAGTKKKEEQRL